MVEVAFGPEDGAAEALVLKVMDSATKTIRLAAFAFSAPKVVASLVRAKERGVDVRVVCDYSHNIEKDASRIGRNALDWLVKVGIPARTNDKFRLLHDKFIIVDDLHLQTGSYNYADSANRNSENVLVIWNDPLLAAQYLPHWEDRFDGGVDYVPKGAKA